MSKIIKAKYNSELVQGFTHRTALEEAARCLLCHDAPCSKGCPAGTDPAKFVRSIRFRNVKGAAETIRSNNVMGGTCARICPYDRLCEEACSRCGIDKPIQIGKLQRYAIEQEKLFGMKTLEVSEEKKNGKIACVGAGPASLACAAELAKAGYKVTVFEREAKAGGACSYGIIPHRLPQSVVDWDVAQVKALGVKFKFNHEVKNEDLEQFDAVFVGAGLWAGNKPKIEGAELKGVYDAIDFLKQARVNKTKFDPGRRVVVVGGGDTAVDCAVTAKLLGAEDVRVLYRRTIEEAPASIDEFHYLLSMGIGITTGLTPVAAKGSRKITSVEAKGFYDKKADMTLSCDTLVFATGQKAEDLSDVAELPLNDNGTIKVKKNGSAGDRFFAAGDVVNGGKTVVEAVAAGKEAAGSIISFLEKKGVK